MQMGVIEMLYASESQVKRRRGFYMHMEETAMKSGKGCVEAKMGIKTSVIGAQRKLRALLSNYTGLETKRVSTGVPRDTLRCSLGVDD